MRGSGQQAKHPRVATTRSQTLCLRGMGQRPMVAKRYDPELSPTRPLGVFDAACAVRLAPLPVRDLKSRYFFTPLMQKLHE